MAEALSSGQRIPLRSEDFIVTRIRGGSPNDNAYIVKCEGPSELVRGHRFVFDLKLGEYDIVRPEDTRLFADDSSEKKAAHLKPERSLLYVAMTRAVVDVVMMGRGSGVGELMQHLHRLPRLASFNSAAPPAPAAPPSARTSPQSRAAVHQ